MIGILFIVVGSIVLLTRQLLRPIESQFNKIPGSGIVKRRVEQNARVWFFVEFQDQNGVVHIAESCPYKSTKGKYRKGEHANIHYYFTRKGRAFCVIDDPDMISCEADGIQVSKNMLIISVSLIALGVVCLGMYIATLLLY